jgi:hypothetical protein
VFAGEPVLLILAHLTGHQCIVLKVAGRPPLLVVPVLARPDWDGFGSLGGRADSTSTALRFPESHVVWLDDAALPSPQSPGILRCVMKLWSEQSICVVTHCG